jgi:hypothetical protein
MDDNISLTRRELYDLVWTTPMEHLAKKFGLSVPGMAKLCRPTASRCLLVGTGRSFSMAKIQSDPNCLPQRDLTMTA